DEVGLGKTLVARGVIARAIDHLWDKVKRIDVIYICSNAAIARQNLARLAIPGCPVEQNLATRLTLLPLHTGSLAQRRVNFIALTPSTSFEQTSGGGRAEERVLLYWLLREAWNFGERAAPKNVLREWSKLESFQRQLNRHDPYRVDRVIADCFVNHLRSPAGLTWRRTFEELCEAFPRSNSRPEAEILQTRGEWLAGMRRELARFCLDTLEPDLVILDEFQRFRDLLDAKNDAAELARQLFDYMRTGEESARTLLLSATPYKMLSLHGDTADDHFSDLLRTLHFLNPDEAWMERLRAYRQATLSPGSDRAPLAAARDELAAALRQVMARTERITAAETHRDTVSERILSDAAMEAVDVQGWIGLQKAAAQVGHGDAVEFWKSAPYALNFMVRRYQLKQKFLDACAGGDRKAMKQLVTDHPHAFLDVEAIRRWKPIPAANAKLRALAHETLDGDAWRCLWLPPSLPSWPLSGPFAQARCTTKSLVFSSWHVAPRSVAGWLSYEAERRMMGPRPPRENTVESRKKRKPLLLFRKSAGRLGGLPLMLLVYPCHFFARRFDPVTQAGRTFSEQSAAVAEALRTALTKVLHHRPTHGPEDERWYWFAPLWLDQHHHPVDSREWWRQEDLATLWHGGTDSEDEDDEPTHLAWEHHVSAARMLLENPGELGRVPADLFDLLALAALAAPATSMWRALRKTCPREAPLESRLAAGQIGHAFLSLFNLPEVTTLLRSQDSDQPYWRQTLDYCRDGCLPAVLEEYAHLLAEAPHEAQDAFSKSAVISREICDALQLRAAPLRVDEITVPPNGRRVQVNAGDEGTGRQSIGTALRLRFAMRFGSDQGEAVAESEDRRRERVRSAFNSPFWPMVLVTTSVGQEGLDFHRYCHRVVHWNLPSNPVDLEQREGRVNRYKNHALRRNVADQFQNIDMPANGDLWEKLFQTALDHRPADSDDLVPYWVYGGPHKIERCVPLFPFSRESFRLPELRRALTVYRMAFGHNRQEDVIEHLLATIPPEEQATLAAEVRLDLRPRPASLD
ncbi:MAG: hypothetical protein KDK99_10585, partial [Verrucomicrobiales bacterium]|nr:hypothetical protein [Verrucomicrobiales bacterium]